MSQAATSENAARQPDDGETTCTDANLESSRERMKEWATKINCSPRHTIPGGEDTGSSHQEREIRYYEAQGDHDGRIRLVSCDDQDQEEFSSGFQSGAESLCEPTEPASAGNTTYNASATDGASHQDQQSRGENREGSSYWTVAAKWIGQT
jgi:hypothetical protein